MKKPAIFMGQLCHLRHRKNDPGFVVSPHHADYRDPLTERLTVLGHIECAIGIDRNTVDQVSLAFQVFADRQRRRVFYHGGDDLPAFRHQFNAGMQRRRGRFGGAGGKNDFTGVIGAQQGGNLLMRTFQRPARGQTKVVNR